MSRIALLDLITPRRSGSFRSVLYGQLETDYPKFDLGGA